jgi:hypothetical protein
VSGKPIDAAMVNFTVPKVSCASSRGATNGVKPAYQGLMWVGIGGINGHYGANSGAVKQDGVAVDCTSLHATAVYFPFWEVNPGKPSPVQFSKAARVYPGAQISAEVFAPSESPVAGQWYFLVNSTYKGVTSVWHAHYASPVTTKNYTAEAITEKNAPGFVDLGNVTYTYADYYTDEMESFNSITADPITLENSKNRPIVLAGRAYQPSGDDLKDSFTTSYAANWLR